MLRQTQDFRGLYFVIEPGIADVDCSNEPRVHQISSFSSFLLRFMCALLITRESLRNAIVMLSLLHASSKCGGVVKLSAGDCRQEQVR